MVLLQSVCILILALEAGYVGAGKRKGNTAVCIDVHGSGEWVMYDPSVANCTDGLLVQAPTESPIKPPANPSPMQKTNPTSIPKPKRQPKTHRTSPRPIRIPKPTSVPKRKRQRKTSSPLPRTFPPENKVYESCGNGVYLPDFQTCCKIISYKFKVHDNMADKEHVCCGLDVYPRDAAVPCRHAARDDRFYKCPKYKQKRLRKLLAQTSTKFGYAYSVHVTDTDERGYRVNIQQIALIPSNSMKLANKILVLPRDKHSPARPNLLNHSFLVLATEDLLHLRLDFILGTNDEAFFVSKGSNTRKMERVIRGLKKAFKKKQNNPRSRRRRNKKSRRRQGKGKTVL